jgi:phenylacetate-coenzyme A ligase PaaK-like adenylate-forming protein
MRLLEKCDDWLVGHVSFPLTNYLFNRRGVMGMYQRMVRSEQCPPEEIEALQLRKLRELVRHAGSVSPYYAAKFKAIGLAPEDIRTLADVKRIPALDRQEVIANAEDMVDAGMRPALAAAKLSKRGPGQPVPLGRFRGQKLVRNTSSGSTGAPVVFYDDGSMAAVSWAFEMRLRKWYGIDPGAREARMARISVDYMPKDSQVLMRKRLWHQLMLPGVNLADKEYAFCLERLREFRPRVLWGFTSALAGLADYVQRTGADVRECSPELAIGWAAHVYEHEERILREVFGCAVTNIYGAREVGHVAAWCPDHTWHINQEHMLVECNENPSDGEIGEILVTPLDPSPMPFIRYRLGDLGRPAPSRCSCGRTLQVIEDFLGRTGEVFVTKDGRMIPPNFWCRFFMVDGQSQFVERFQVIYRRPDLISIKIVKRQGFDERTEEDMKKILRKNFSSEVHFEFEYVPKIAPQISGKYQMVVNETRNQSAGELHGSRSR